MTIFLDLDGMVANLQQSLMDRFNGHSDCWVEPIDYSNVWTAVASDGRPVSEHIDDMLVHDNIFDDLELIPGALWAHDELCKLGHVVIASSPSRNPDSASAKIRWVIKHLGIHRRDIILIKHKHLLRGDAFFEDWGPNIKAIRETNPNAFIGAIAYPYNADAFVGSWDWKQRDENRFDPAINIDNKSGFHCRAEGVNDFEGAWRKLIRSFQEWSSEQRLTF